MIIKQIKSLFWVISLIISFTSCNSGPSEISDAEVVCKCLNNNQSELYEAKNKVVKDSIFIDCYARLAVLKGYYLKQDLDTNIGNDLENDSCHIYLEHYKTD